MSEDIDPEDEDLEGGGGDDDDDMTETDDGEEDWGSSKKRKAHGGLSKKAAKKAAKQAKKAAKAAAKKKGRSSGGAGGGGAPARTSVAAAAAPAQPVYAQAAAEPPRRAFQPVTQVPQFYDAVEAQKALSLVFKDVIQILKSEPSVYGVKKSPAKFASFMVPVSLTVVPDYPRFVPESDQMWVDKVHGRAKSNKYSTRQAFESDIRQILVACQAYNTPGRGGKQATPFLIDLCQQMVDLVTQALDTKQPLIEAAERAIEEGRAAANAPRQARTKAGTSTAYNEYVADTVALTGAGGGSAQQGGGGAAAADGGGGVGAVGAVKETWVECEQCKMWRVVPEEYLDGFTKQHGEDAPWFCRYYGCTCHQPRPGTGDCYQ
uniref:Bromo domain-containing protein n=1 Tax=Chlamydomonas leiostraca TaxID=1034604 RepID=A0A7S0S0Z8_9CHLO